MPAIRRTLALSGLAVRRTVGRLRASPQRLVLSVFGVVLAVGLMVAVTGVSLGLASESVISSDETDYWIVPEESNVQSVVVSTGGVQLSEVHETSARIAADERVDYSLPVLLELLPVRDAVTGERTYLLAVGVVAQPDAVILGLSTEGLTPGDPHYANGSYDGRWTGEAIMNDAAAQTINASTGTTLESGRASANQSLTVANVTSVDSATAMGQLPVALVHLSELQAITGAESDDQADQILVSTNDPAVKQRLQGIYPRTTVVERNGLAAQQVSTSNLPLAIAVSAVVTAVVVGVLFVTTLMGLEVTADREHLGTLTAIGVSRRSQSIVVAVETVTVAVVGGIGGLLVGLVVILGINAAGREFLGLDPIATFDPLLVGYAMVIALVIGLVGAVYPVLLSRRTDALEVIL
ncbi:FtsX-like permease family protein [Halosimplex aquaticum]|uniref:FtsX-like permease family protein n=1 Tax=Halosimplex aquaticum TaxID=3026162 RepID=A0ABD5Y3Y4_9EURY|nr:FtsX-like permease family protein [Halosimplex aquaticum]